MKKGHFFTFLLLGLLLIAPSAARADTITCYEEINKCGQTDNNYVCPGYGTWIVGSSGKTHICNGVASCSDAYATNKCDITGNYSCVDQDYFCDPPTGGQIACTANSDCNDSNSCTTDTCTNPGQPTSVCSYPDNGSCTNYSPTPTPTGGGGGGGGGTSCMTANSAVRSCSGYFELTPVYKATSAECATYCLQSAANACEWTSNGGLCYVEYGTGCQVQGGFSGWYATVFPGACGGAGATPTPTPSATATPALTTTPTPPATPLPGGGLITAQCSSSPLQNVLTWTYDSQATTNGLQRGNATQSVPGCFSYMCFIPTVAYVHQIPTPGNPASYTDTDLVNGQCYEYRVKYKPSLVSNSVFCPDNCNLPPAVGSITVSSPDATTTWAIPGAGSGSGFFGYYSNLPAGTYTLSSLESPPGYVCTPDAWSKDISVGAPDAVFNISCNPVEEMVTLVCNGDTDGECSIPYGTTAVMTWTSATAISCEAYSPESTNWSGSKSVPTGRTDLLNLTFDQALYLNCVGPYSSFYDVVFTTITTATVPTVSSVRATEPDYCQSSPAITESWNFADASGSGQSAYRVQIDDDPSFLNSNFDTGKVMSSSKVYVQTGLAFNTTYYSRVMVWNDQDVASTWANQTLCTGPGCSGGGGSWVTPAHAYPTNLSTFSWTPTKPYVGTPTLFEDGSTHCFTSGGALHACTTWLWTFGDTAASSLQSPTHAYTALGDYTVDLSVSDGTYSCSTSKLLRVQTNFPTWREVLPK